MKKIIVTGVLALIASLPAMLAQQQDKRPKNQEEAKALQEWQASLNDPDANIKAADELLAKFPETAFKDVVLYYEAANYSRKGDAVHAQIYGERALEANPKNYEAELLVSQLLAQHTREFDLDKEEKLTKAEKYAKDAIQSLSTMPKPNPNLPDQQWEEIKKDTIADAHNTIGVCALTRKKFDVAITEFRAAVEGGAHPEPAYQVRLASALQQAGNNDEAIAVCDKVLADPQLHPQIKQVATSVKTAATQAKAKAPGGAAPVPKQ